VNRNELILVDSIKRIADSLEKIAEGLNGPQTLMQHRVAAYNRIKEAVRYADSFLESIDEALEELPSEHSNDLEPILWNDWKEPLMKIKEILSGKSIK